MQRTRRAFIGALSALPALGSQAWAGNNREFTQIMRQAGTPTIASITGASVVRSPG